MLSTNPNQEAVFPNLRFRLTNRRTCIKLWLKLRPSPILLLYLLQLLQAFQLGLLGGVREEAIWTFPKIRVPPNHPILIGYPILIGFSFINHPFWGFSPYFRKPPYIYSIPTVNFSPADSWMTSLALLTEMATEKMTQAGQEKKHGNRKEK